MLDLCKDEEEYNAKISALIKTILAQPNLKDTWIDCSVEDQTHFKQVVNDIFSKMLFDQCVHYVPKLEAKLIDFHLSGKSSTSDIEKVIEDYKKQKGTEDATEMVKALRRDLLFQNVICNLPFVKFPLCDLSYYKETDQKYLTEDLKKRTNWKKFVDKQFKLDEIVFSRNPGRVTELLFFVHKYKHTFPDGKIPYLPFKKGSGNQYSKVKSAKYEAIMRRQ